MHKTSLKVLSRKKTEPVCCCTYFIKEFRETALALSTKVAYLRRQSQQCLAKRSTILVHNANSVKGNVLIKCIQQLTGSGFLL